MTTKFRLPVVIENSVGRVEVLRHDLATNFDRKVQTEVPKVGARITCAKGCHWCCYQPVTISILEGISIYRWLRSKGKWTLALRAKLRETSDKQLATTYEVWLLAMIPCPLLDVESKTCVAYKTRPLICRSYYAVSDPYYCHPHRMGDQTLILPRDLVTDPFHSTQETILRKHRLQLMTMPLGKALLYAEEVCAGKVDLDTIDALILTEYGEKG